MEQKTLVVMIKGSRIFSALKSIIARLFWLLLPIPLMAMKVNILTLGVIGLILVYGISSRSTRKKISMYLYIAMMALVFYSLFLAHDPFELPSYISDIISYAIIIGTLIGFYRQIEGSMRTDFGARIEGLRTDLGNRIDNLRNDNVARLTEIKSDFQREIDKLERRIDDQIYGKRQKP
jgi:hypothetical protein